MPARFVQPIVFVTRARAGPSARRTLIRATPLRVRPLAPPLEADDRALAPACPRSVTRNRQPRAPAGAHPARLDPQPQLRVGRPRRARVVQQQLDVAVGRLAGGGGDVDLRVVVREHAADRGQLRRGEVRAPGPAGGASTGASLSNSVPKIESVPSQFSISSISRCVVGQSAIAGRLDLPEAGPALGLVARHAVVVRVAGDECDDVRVREEQLLQLVAQVERLRTSAGRGRSPGFVSWPCSSRSVQSLASSSEIVEVSEPVAWCANSDDQLVALGRRVELLHEPLPLRVVDVPVGGERDHPALRQRVEHDEADVRQRAPRVVRRRAVRGLGLLLRDVREAVRVGLLAGARAAP